MTSAESIADRLMRDLLGNKLIENALRGYWCEHMLAEAIGPECRVVSSGWHPWDLQIGPDHATFPERVRIQIKNSARRQTWHSDDDQGSDCSFNLPFRRIPHYFARDNPGVPCEPEGFMCELFALCHHDRFEGADHTDPAQWSVFLLPVAPELGAITEAERNWVGTNLAQTGKPSSLQRRPHSMQSGIRGRRPIQSLPVTELSLENVYATLGLSK